ncbi:alpha/beta hydrolase [Plebeiibacterium sediminum]|uniref:Alpha/beta hydrolase n=1 Tax=Plebeiibacterium sediminum TaxID=2992112 RepID=A0AAE3SFX9_9BACT|nr:alpha/beta hydrolase [Plebeiobacterium sediminum]MCW3787756.1 alpha/beta hydrolase [Plebeiobacterium sediminum]
MYKILSVLFCLLTLSSFTLLPKDEDNKYRPDQTAIYKTIESTQLHLEIFFPKKHKCKKKPAIVFFYGGGWKYGSINQFAPHAEYYKQKGFVTILVDYRVEQRHRSTPFDAVEDAKSAMRYIKQQGQKLRIDTSKIIACGGSAGGHLAAATALINSYNSISDNINISPKPNALILFNPVIDNGPEGYGFERIGDEYKHFSPMHNIVKRAPPTIILIGTKDQLIPVKTIENYKTKMDSVGSICQIKFYKDQKHGFFNYKHTSNYNHTLTDMNQFLIDLGYLKKDK